MVILTLLIMLATVLLTQFILLQTLSVGWELTLELVSKLMFNKSAFSQILNGQLLLLNFREQCSKDQMMEQPILKYLTLTHLKFTQDGTIGERHQVLQ